MPATQEKPGKHEFHPLPATINQSLTRYRHYKLFEPWPQPTLYVEFPEGESVGQVTGYGDLKLQLQPIGQAQAWFGTEYGVLWEAYLFETRRRGNWQEEMAHFWQAVEQAMGAQTVFTQDHEPTFEEGYTDFLRQLGYAPSRYPRWWSKTIV